MAHEEDNECLCAGPSTSRNDRVPPIIPPDKLFLDFSGTGESADLSLSSSLISGYGPIPLDSTSTNLANTTIPELGKYNQSKDYGKQKRRKFRTQRLEGLRAAHVWCQEYKGRLLRKAVQSEEVSLIRELLDEGVHVDNCDEKQRTALHLASVKGNATIVELLLSRGANPNCKDVNQNTPLMLACLARHIAIITRLLKAGANPKLCDSKGHDALTIAQNRLTHLQQCQLACDYLRDELLHVISMIKEYVHQKDTVALCAENNSTEKKSISSSLEEDQLNTMISRLTFNCSESDLSSTREVADEFQELLLKFSAQVKVS